MPSKLEDFEVYNTVTSKSRMQQHQKYTSKAKPLLAYRSGLQGIIINSKVVKNTDPTLRILSFLLLASLKPFGRACTHKTNKERSPRFCNAVNDKSLENKAHQ